MPMKPGHYGGVNGGQDVVTIQIPAIPDIILGFLAGEMIAEIKGNARDGAEELCAKITVQLEIPEH